MKKIYMLGTALLMLLLLAGIVAAVPPVSPPAPQVLGVTDTKFENQTIQICKNCHPDPVDIHHAMVGGNTNYGTPLGCEACHPPTDPAIGYNSGMIVSRVCQDCHKSNTAWDPYAGTPYSYGNSYIVNLTKLRGAPGRPHHNTTKSAVWEYPLDASYRAADRQCAYCHSPYVVNYNDGHVPPSYNASMITPMADFKLNATKGNGSEYGGCAVCHGDGVVNGVTINNNHDNHHYVRFWTGYQCNNCHVASGFRAEPIPDYNPEPNAQFLTVWYNQSYPQYLRYGWDTSQRHIELRNSTILNAGDALNGTGCQKCHSYQSLHAINNSAAFGGAPGHGHAGVTSDADCRGCHFGNSLFLDVMPSLPEMATTIQLDSATPSIVSANVPTDVTITGSNLMQSNYNTEVLVDGAVAIYSGLTETSVAVNVNLNAGGHIVQVKKTKNNNPTDTTTSTTVAVSAISSPTLTAAELASGVLTITGAGFGTTDMTSVTIVKPDGKQILAATTSWSDTVIVASAASVAAGDSVTVLTKTGSATATITVPPPASLTVTIPNNVGISWKRGTTQTIRWTTTGDTGATVTIQTTYINSKGKTVTTTIASGAANSGSYGWNIPRTQPVDNDYKVIVTSSGGQTDSSDNYFSIK